MRCLGGVAWIPRGLLASGVRARPRWSTLLGLLRKRRTAALARRRLVGRSERRRRPRFPARSDPSCPRSDSARASGRMTFSTRSPCRKMAAAPRFSMRRIYDPRLLPAPLRNRRCRFRHRRNLPLPAPLVLMGVSSRFPSSLGGPVIVRDTASTRRGCCQRRMLCFAGTRARMVPVSLLALGSCSGAVALVLVPTATASTSHAMGPKTRLLLRNHLCRSPRVERLGKCHQRHRRACTSLLSSSRRRRRAARHRKSVLACPGAAFKARSTVQARDGSLGRTLTTMQARDLAGRDSRVWSIWVLLLAMQVRVISCLGMRVALFGKH